MAADPNVGQQNAAPTAFLNQIKDPHVRNAIRELFNQIGTLTGQTAAIGVVTKPLTTHLIAGGNQVKRMQDPSDPQDAVTLRFLQSYMANFASALGSAGAAGGGTGTDPSTETVPAPSDQSGIVEAVRVTLGINSGSTPLQLFKFAQTVVWNINTLGPDPVAGNVGLLHQDAGDGTYYCPDMADTLACFRICYDNGANIKILTGSYTTQWTQEADVAVTDWRAPTDPVTVCP